MAATALALPPFARAQDADPVVARVNGAEIRASDVTVAEEDLGGQLPQMAPEAKRDYIVTFLADMMLVAKAAEARKLADGDEFKRRMAYFRTKLLMEQLLQTEAKAAVNDAAMRKLYDEAIKQIKAEREVKARHILLRVADPKDEKASQEAETKIKAVVERLKKGEDFVAVAKELTEDPSGKENGGDLGYFTKDQMVPEFAEVAFKLDKGQLSEPVKTQFGWHVLKVEDKRDRQPPPFEAVKGQLENFLVRKTQSELISKLRAEGKIERVAPPAPPAATPATPAPTPTPPKQ